MERRHPVQPTGSSTPGARNGQPVGKPYRWRGDPRAAEIQAQLAALRDRLATSMLDICEAVEGPDPDWYRERDTEMKELAVPAPVAALLPRLVIVPYSVNGRRRPQPGTVPPSLAARLASWREPPPAPARPSRRCRRCGYVITHCSCQRRRAA